MDPNISCAAGAGAGAGLTIVAAGAGAGAGIANTLSVCAVSGGFIAAAGVLLNASQPFPPTKPPFVVVGGALIGTTAATEVVTAPPNTPASCDCASAGAGVTKPPSPKGSACAGAGDGT